MSTNTIAKKLQQHIETVEPGQPAHLTDAHQPGEGVWQGDLGIEIVADYPPIGYVEITDPTDADRQLVPLGGGPGSHHRLRSLDGVRLLRPADWGQDPSDLRGPYIEFYKPNAIVHEPGHAHPHGTVYIDAPMKVLIRYQRNLSARDQVMLRAVD